MMKNVIKDIQCNVYKFMSIKKIKTKTTAFV